MEEKGWHPPLASPFEQLQWAEANTKILAAKDQAILELKERIKIIKTLEYNPLLVQHNHYLYPFNGLKDIPMDSFIHIYKKQDDWVFPFPL